jgi:hypothetical protein
MKSTREQDLKKVSETARKMFRTFADNVGEIFDDPDVKAKAKALAESVVDAAAKVGQNKVTSEEMRAKYRNVGKAAKTLGSSLEKHFDGAAEQG